MNLVVFELRRRRSSENSREFSIFALLTARNAFTGLDVKGKGRLSRSDGERGEEDETRRNFLVGNHYNCKAEQIPTK